jgi:hypothetical protein
MIEWNAETEQWEVNGQKFKGEILLVQRMAR